MNDALSRAVRTIIQLIAAGGATALFDALTGMVDLQYQVLVGAVFMVIITFCQNYLEDTGKIPTLLGKKEDASVRASRPRVL